MDGTQGVIVLSLMAAMLAFHSVNCKPFSFSFPQPTSTTGRSDFPAFSPVPFYNPYQFQFPNYNYEPWSQGGTRARSQSHAVANNKEIASEQFLSAVGSFLVSYILNRIQDEIRSDDSGVVSHATAQYRGPAHVNQDDDIDSDQTLEELLDQLIEKYGDQLPENPTKVQENHAKGQFFSSIFNRRNWQTARECLNDVFESPTNTMTARERQAAINELRDVWMGKTDLSKASAQVRLNWQVVRDCIDRFAYRDNPNTAKVNSWWWPFSQSCNQALYVMAFTGGSQNALTNHPPFIELIVEGEIGLVQLPEVTGLEFQNDKGDLWAINLGEFGLSTTCIRQRDIEGIAVVEGGTDGWLIDSIVTFLLDVDGNFSLLSSDIDVDRWIDGNGGEERKRFDLTIG